MWVDSFDISGEVVVVTGGGGELGKALSISLADAGAKVAVVDIVEDRAKLTCKEIAEVGGEAIFVSADLTKGDEVRNAVDEIARRFGRIDVLINNAGTVLGKLVLDVDEQEWHKVLNVNLTSTFLCSKFAGKYMIEQNKGKVINISSIAGLVGAKGQSAYCASKAGVLLLTKCLALEWAKYNVTVNAIAPGYIRAGLSASVLQDEVGASKVLMRIPLKRFALPEEIAPLVIFLASRASDYMTGETILIDGGLLCHV